MPSPTPDPALSGSPTPAVVRHRATASGPPAGPSIVTRVLGAFLLVLIVAGATIAHALSVQRDLVDRLARVNDQMVPLVGELDDVSRTVGDLVRALSEREPALLRASVTASVRLARAPERVLRTLEGAEARAQALEARVAPREQAFFANTRGALTELRRDADEVLLRVRALTEDPAALDDPARVSTLARDAAALDKRLRDLASLLREQTRVAVERAEDERVASARRVIVSALAAGLLALIAAALSLRSLRPIRQLTAEAMRIKGGDYRAPTIEGVAEVGLLAREFASMAEAIEDRDRQLRTRREELERAYRELVEAQHARLEAERLAALAELASRVTHEIRNPLSSIRLNAGMLADELRTHLPADAEAHELIGIVERETERLAGLTAEYLSLARGAHARAAAPIVPVVEDVLRQLGPEATRAGVKLVLDAPPPVVPHAALREDALRQLLVNLLTNGIWAASTGSPPPEGRRVHVGLRLTNAPEGGTSGATREARTVELLVYDTGPGIDPDVLPRLFAPFVTTRADGTGLGLDICRRLVESERGTLEAEARGPLGGALFRAHLGVAADMASE